MTAVYTWGELEGEPVTSDTVWPVASLTKPVFVYGVMRLVNRGLLDLDRSLQAYLPPHYLDDSVYRPAITARHAMSHSTGFPNWRPAEGLRAAFMPGTKFSYSSEGLTYLQRVVEHITGMPLSAYLNEQVFLPLGMKQARLQAESHADLPPMLHFLEGSLLANAALSLRTTVADYAQFMAAMLRDGPGVSDMLQPQVAVGDVPNLWWGLGWGIQQVAARRTFWHWGARGTPRTMCFALGIPSERRSLVIFTNHADGLLLCRAISELWIGSSSLPAFDWLLPAHEWRPDGKQRRA